MQNAFTMLRRNQARIHAPLLVVLLIGSHAFPVFAEEGSSYLGRPLIEVLNEMKARGLPLVFSTAVVGEDLRVTVEPAATDLRAVLEEILAPLGLKTREGPGGSVLVVPRGEGAGIRRGRGLVTEVVVTPSKLSLVQQEQASRLTVTNKDAVLVPTIGGDVSRVVELLPGIAAPDNSAAFNVRGSQARDVSVILDGLELYEPFHLQSLQSPFSFIDAKIVDRIDFFGGGFTVDMGDRHGGVVKMSTWLPEDPHRTRIELGTLNTRVSHGAPIAAGSGSWLVSARSWYPEALRDTMELGESGLDPTFGDLYAKASFSVDPHTVLSVHGLFAYDRLDYAEEDGNETVDSKNRSGYLWFRLMRSWSKTVFSETVLSGGRIDRSREGVSEPEDVIHLVRDDRTVDFFGLKHDSTWRISDAQMLKAGAEVRKLTAEYQYSSGLPGEVDSLELDPKGTSYAVYVAHRARAGPDLVTEFGVRWDRQTVTQDNQVSPRFHAVWRAGERSELRMGLGRFFQSQRILELHVEDRETDFLQAELSTQADLTFQHRFPSGIRFRLDGYFRRLTRVHPRWENLFNPIELYPETEVDRVTVAPDRARSFGAELLLRSDPNRPLAWWVSYTRSTVEDRIAGRYVPRSWDQTHSVKFLLGYRPGDRWWVSLSGAAHTGWPTTPVFGEIVSLPNGSTEIEPILGERNSVRYPSYWRLDVKASRSFTVGRGRLRLDLEVVNVTDRDNVCCVDEFEFTALPGGTVDVRTTYDPWLGITPSASILWEF
jgi:hypothetical protein